MLMGAATYGGRGFKPRAGVSGKRPIGAASCKQQRNRASCQNPLLGDCQFCPNRIFSAPTAGPTVCDRRLPPPPTAFPTVANRSHRRSPHRHVIPLSVMRSPGHCHHRKTPSPFDSGMFV